MKCIRPVMLLVILSANCFADFLNIQSGAFLYESSTYDVKDSVSSSGPSLSRSFGTTFNYQDPLLPGSNLHGSYSAIGSVSYGVLHATTDSEQFGLITYPSIAVYTTADFEDALSFFTSSGASGNAYLEFTIDGSGSGTNSDTFEGVHTQTWGGFQAGKVGTTQTDQFVDTTDKTVSVMLKSDPILFTNGSPVQIEASLSAALSMACNTEINLAVCNFWVGNAISNFGNTAVLTGIELFDNTGSPITNFTITSQSGTLYSANGVVPEPETLALLLSVVALLRPWRWNKACSMLKSSVDVQE